MTGKEDKAFTYCFTEMFLRVGENYPNDELTSDPHWYRLRTWTIQEEKYFEEWMVSYLRKALGISKKRAIVEAAYFMMNYSWINSDKFPLKVIER